MKVKQDQKGIYIAHADRRVRPQANNAINKLVYGDTVSTFVAGDNVKKNHISGSTVVYVSKESRKEYWFIHYE